MTKPRMNDRKRGPKPEVLKLEGDVDWKDAIKHALQKKKPTGWPEDQPPKSKKK